MTNLKRVAIASAIALGIAGVAAYGHGYGPGATGGGYGMGAGMMGGYGGYGMGPGMMGGYGGYGMGPGMMGGGYGVHAGMIGGIDPSALERLGLNEQQRARVTEIQDGLRKKNWEVMDKMHDAMTKLRDAGSTSDKKDWDAILAGNRQMSDLRLQLTENSIKATRDVEAVLTPQQRASLAKSFDTCFDDD